MTKPKGLPNLNPDDEPRLAALIQTYKRTHDQALLDELVALYTPHVMSISKRYKWFNSSEDVAQIGFIGLLKALRDCNPDQMKTFLAYARIKIHAEIRNARVRGKRRPVLRTNMFDSEEGIPTPMKTPSLLSAEPSADQVMADHDEMDYLFGALKDPLHRAVMHLLHVEGCSLAEVAGELDLPLAKVRRAETLALQILRGNRTVQEAAVQQGIVTESDLVIFTSDASDTT